MEGRGSLKEWGRGIGRATARLALLFGWWLLVCYDVRFPIFFRNLVRYLRFPVDPSVATWVPVDLGQPPVELERFVEEWVQPAIDYHLYGLPWVVPTPKETVRLRAGDCEARAFLLASLLEAKGVPYFFRASPSHLWVEYPGKPSSFAESDAVAYMTRIGGRFRFRLPPWKDWGRNLRIQKSLLWDPMPPARKGLLLGGWGWLVAHWCRRRRRRGEAEPSSGSSVGQRKGSPRLGAPLQP